MAAQFNSPEDGAFSGINVTPLVDIMLVLLIVFMVTAKLIVSRSMPMDLPKATTGHEEQMVFAVAVKASGELSVDAKPIANDAELLARARKAHEARADLRAVIQADRAVPHGRVVNVMDVLAKAGIGKVAFSVTKASCAELGHGECP